MEQITNAIAELQAEVQRQRDEIAFLRSLATNRTSSKPKASLPDPEKFNGQTHKFDTWLPSIKAKLRVDGDAIGDATAQFYYVYLNLDSHVQAMVLPQLSRAEDDSAYDYNTILEQLARVYDNPNKVQEAEDKLFSLKQNTDALHAYMAKFERILYEAHGQDWPDVNKISTFRNGLNSTLRNRLAQQLNLPRKYSEFVRIVQQLAGRSTGFPQTTSSSHNYHSSSNGNHNYSQEPMDVSTINIGAINTSTSPTRARSLSPARRDQYRKEGKCVRCGDKGHWVKDCKLAPYNSSSVGITGKKVTIAALDDDDKGSYSDCYSDGGSEEDERVLQLIEYERQQNNGRSRTSFFKGGG
jgi:hypothetical protein